MAEEKTVVEYDASKAMSEIAQLERRIQQLEGKTKRSFDKAAESADNFEKSVKGVSSSAGGLVGSFRNLASGVTPFGVALGAASGGIIKLVTDIVELPPVLRSTEERIKAVIDTLDRLADTAKAGIKLRGTIDTVQIEEQVKALSIRRANLQEERVEVTERRDVLKEKLAAEKDYFAQRKALAQQSGREVARLEDLAAGIREKRFLQSVAGQDLPRALDQLLSRAAQLRGKGGEENFRQAERLIDRAAGLAHFECGGD